MSESQYLVAVKQNQELDRAQIGGIALISNENKALLLDGMKYTNYLGDPQTADFKYDYILNNPGEFTTPEAKLAQAVNEHNGRIGSVLQENYQLAKTQLELDKLQVEHEFKRGAINQADYDAKVKDNELQVLDLEIQNKQVTLRKQELAFQARVEDTLSWKVNIDRCLKEIGVDSIEKVDLGMVRPNNMLGKIRHWGVRHAEGTFEFTPSVMPIIEKHREVFHAGVTEGLDQLAQINPGLFIQRCKALGIQLGPVAPEPQQQKQA